jgi:hypothetical protein
MNLDLVSKHKHFLDMLKWEDEDIHIGEFVQVVAWPLNPGIQDLDGSLKAYIYIDDILASAVNKFNILRLLAATTKAILLYAIDQISKSASVCSLSRNRKNLWLARYKLF